MMHRHRKSQTQQTPSRSAFTLLESIMALALAALLMAPVVGMLRTSHEIWEKSDSDRTRLDAMHGTLRHIARRLRTAESVLAIESASGKPAILQIRTQGGQVLRWTHDYRSGQVVFDNAATKGTLGEHIDALRFEGFAADGRATDIPGTIHTIRCTATVSLKRKNDAIKTSYCDVWLRASF